MNRRKFEKKAGNGYRVRNLQNGVKAIDDGRGGAMYLVEGTERAALIDTGMSVRPLFPLIRELTDLPVSLFLTHAHIDHMYHWDEFDRVYIYEREISAFGRRGQLLMDVGALLFRVSRKRYPVRDFLPLREGESVSLGETELVCVPLGGHTAGSALFVDAAHKTVFCGDAVGSGSGVWMFLPDSTDVEEYRRQLGRALEILRPCAGYRFLGGHSGQDTGENAFPLSYQTLADMYQLCGQVLDGVWAPQIVKPLPFLKLFYGFYGQAAIVTRERKM